MKKEKGLDMWFFLCDNKTSIKEEEEEGDKKMQLNKYLNKQTANTNLIHWIEHNLKNYLETNPENQTEIEHILDYLNSPDAPKRLNRMSYEQAKISTDKWNTSLIKKASDVRESTVDTELVVVVESEMRLVKLTGKAAYQYEGAQMGHCVSSYFENSKSSIYSLRDRNNEPHCTIELDTKGSINQIKGKQNKPIVPKYVSAVLQSLEYLKCNIRSSEMDNLGYDSFEGNEGMWSFLESNFVGIQEIKFKEKRYFYKSSVLVAKGMAA
jgi:hypothetical protein